MTLWVKVSLKDPMVKGESRLPNYPDLYVQYPHLHIHVPSVMRKPSQPSEL